jgi:hypothetical protein
MTGSRVLKIIGWVFLGVAIAVSLGFVLGFGLMWLWNWLMPALFGLPVITYWQAVGLFVLCHLLFKGHHHHGGGDKDGECGPPWKKHRDSNPFARKIHGLVCKDDGEVEGAETVAGRDPVPSE